MRDHTQFDALETRNGGSPAASYKVATPLKQRFHMDMMLDEVRVVSTE